MAKLAKVDAGIAKIIAEIALDSFSTAAKKKGKDMTKVVILALKKLLKRTVPEFPVDAVDDLIKVISEGDTEALEGVINELT